MQASELDGKALLCGAGEHSREDSDPFGLVFEKGKISKWVIKGCRKVAIYTHDYTPKGSRQIEWYHRGSRYEITPDTLKYHA